MSSWWKRAKWRHSFLWKIQKIHRENSKRSPNSVISVIIYHFPFSWAEINNILMWCISFIPLIVLWSFTPSHFFNMILSFLTWNKLHCLKVVFYFRNRIIELLFIMIEASILKFTFYFGMKISVIHQNDFK